MLCLAGFILSAMPVILILLGFYTKKLTAFADALPVCLIVLPLAGFIVSIVGLRYARIEGQSGKGFAIAGIALPSTGVIVAAIMFFGFFGLMGSSSMSKEIRKNEMYAMGPLSNPANTEYDVSKYRIPKGFDFKSLDMTISETELKTYAKAKLDRIGKKNDISIKGTREGYNFLIVRSDRFNDWLAVNCPRGEEYYFNQEYAEIMYLDYWEIAATKYFPLVIYKDPSNKFVIITNCNDYKVISEFFK